MVRFGIPRIMHIGTGSGDSMTKNGDVIMLGVKGISGGFDLGFWIWFTTAVIFFHGDPDLHDALIKWLMK